MRQALFLLLLVSTSSLAWSQTNLLKLQAKMVGTTLQELNITDYLQNKPVDTNYNSKFKVLEFWATWCKPCLQAVPHLNQLSREFKDENIVFLSFTYESPEQTRKTLERINFETVVVSDQTKTTHRNLKIEVNGTMALPRTVLIDDANRVVWFGSPQKLNRALLKKFLEGKLYNQ